LYDWVQHQPSRREVADAELGERIDKIHAKSRGTYGAPRVHAQLRRDGMDVARKRVARIMTAYGLAGRCTRRRKRTTIADPDAQAAVDLIMPVPASEAHPHDLARQRVLVAGSEP
jgi:transposase InsO family protein